MFRDVHRPIVRRGNLDGVLLLFGLLGLLLAAAAASAESYPLHAPRDDHGRRPQTSVYTYVPSPEELYTRQKLYFFGKERIEIPGIVAVNKPPYMCDLDGEVFRTKSTFAGHLRSKHRALLHEISHPFVVYEGQVHFSGR